MVVAHGFIENKLNDCIYSMFNRFKFIFLVLYVDDILIAGSNLQLLKETRAMLSSNFLDEVFGTGTLRSKYRDCEGHKEEVLGTITKGIH